MDSKWFMRAKACKAWMRTPIVFQLPKNFVSVSTVSSFFLQSLINSFYCSGVSLFPVLQQHFAIKRWEIQSSWKKGFVYKYWPGTAKKRNCSKARKRNFVECAMLDVAKNDESQKVKRLVFCQLGTQTSFDTWDIVLSSRQTRYSTSLPSSPPFSPHNNNNFYCTLKYQS